MWMPKGGRRLRAAGLTRPSSRGAVRVTAVATVMAAVGLTAGSAGALGQQAVRLTLDYSCSFSSGSQPVSAQVTATFPTTASTGQTVKPTGAGITVTLPHPAVAYLAHLHAATVALTAGLATSLTEGTKTTTADWRDFKSSAVAVPATGPLAVTASGTAAPVTVGPPGTATVSAASLALLFTGQTADHSPASSSSVPAACVPKAGQDTSLAKITVDGSAPPASSVTPSDNPKQCLPYPTGLQKNPLFPLPKPLPGSTKLYHPERACVYSAGFTNARKLHEAALVGPGLADLRLGIPSYIKSTHSYFFFQQDGAGQLEYHGQAVLPPARATLLGFGFMPVSATLQLSEVGSLNIALISCAPNPPGKCVNHPANEALFFGKVTLRIYDVQVNGVPLNVGDHCQTATPFDLKLVGLPPAYNISKIKGVLTGTVTVPSFTGCTDNGENLDPIFDATVSGPGNFAKITQGGLCTPQQHLGCPPKIPAPKH